MPTYIQFFVEYVSITATVWPHFAATMVTVDYQQLCSYWATFQYLVTCVLSSIVTIVYYCHKLDKDNCYTVLWYRDVSGSLWTDVEPFSLECQFKILSMKMTIGQRTDKHSLVYFNKLSLSSFTTAVNIFVRHISYCILSHFTYIYSSIGPKGFC